MGSMSGTKVLNSFDKETQQANNSVFTMIQRLMTMNQRKTARFASRKSSSKTVQHVYGKLANTSVLIFIQRLTTLNQCKSARHAC